MKKRIISFILAVIMVIGLIPVNIFADELEEHPLLQEEVEEVAEELPEEVTEKLPEEATEELPEEVYEELEMPVFFTGNEVSEEIEKAQKTTYKDYKSFWPNFRGNDVNQAIVDVKTPRYTCEAKLKWAVKLGTGWAASPTPPISISDVEIDGKTYDVLAVASGNKIFLLNKDTGATLVTGDMVGNAGFATNPITYAEGMIFVQLDGRIQAFKADTLESLWVSEKIGGQTVSPITYHNGRIYIGLWNGEKKDGKFACFSVNDDDPTQTNETKVATWTLNHKGGFYWAGAYVCDEFAVFGSDDGTNEGDYTANAILYSVDPVTGKVIDTIDGIKGDIRSTIAFDKETNTAYCVTKGGLFIKAPMKADGTFDHDGYATVEMGGMCTSTPIIYNGRAYIGTSGTEQFSSPGVYNVIDVEKMEIVNGLILRGYPQAPTMCSTAYAEQTGKIYFYSTYNAKPGGLTVVELDLETDTYTSSDLFIPETAMQNYCICSPVCDEDGTIYYKNDSGYMMAVADSALGHKYGEPVWEWADDGKSATATFTCENDQNHVEVLNVALENGITAEVKTPAACETKGTTTYKAEVTLNEKTYNGTKEVVDIDATGHTFGAWTDVSGTQERKCSGCGMAQTVGTLVDESTGKVSIDVTLGGEGETATEAVIPAATVQAIQSAAKKDDAVKGVSIELGEKTSVSYDAKAFEKIAETLGEGEEISLELGSVNKGDVEKLNVPEPQKKVLEEALLGEGSKAELVQIELTVNGHEMSDFGGGKATVTVPYHGGVANVIVERVEANGTKTPVPSWLNGDGSVSFETGSHSFYLINEGYQITLDANGGYVTETLVVTGADGTVPTLPDAVRNKYRFVGWFSDEKEVKAGNIISANVTLKAHWEYDGNTTTVVIGKRDNKEETKEVEENPNTGAPVPDFGMSFTVLGAICLVLFEKKKG